MGPAEAAANPVAGSVILGTRPLAVATTAAEIPRVLAPEARAASSASGFELGSPGDAGPGGRLNYVQRPAARAEASGLARRRP